YPYGAFVDDAGQKLARQAQAFSLMIETGWGRKVGAFRELFANLLMPEGAGPELKWIGELQRHSASAPTARQLWNAFNTFDIRSDALKVTAPTLVFHVRGDAMVPFEAGRRLAAAIPNARFLPLEGKNHILGADEQIDTSATEEFAALTAREREILDWIARGQTNAQIAHCLHIAEKTVRNHVTSVFSKLGAQHRSQAIVMARKAGLGRDS